MSKRIDRCLRKLKKIIDFDVLQIIFLCLCLGPHSNPYYYVVYMAQSVW